MLCNLLQLVREQLHEKVIMQMHLLDLLQATGFILVRN
jgi:hypothetical protein